MKRTAKREEGRREGKKIRRGEERDREGEGGEKEKRKTRVKGEKRERLEVSK